MIFYFALFFIFLLLSLFVVFLFRPESRTVVISVISVILFFILDPLFLVPILVLSLSDYLFIYNFISKKGLVVLNILSFVCMAILFSVFPNAVSIGSLSFNLLGFSLIICFFNRLNDLIQNSSPQGWKDILFANSFFPKMFTPVISSFVDETKLIRNEVHFNRENLLNGMKNLFLGFFVFHCLFIPGDRYLSTLNYPPLLFFSKGLLFVSFVYSVYCIGAGCMEVFSYKVYRNFNSPLVPSSFVDFWRRWCVTFFNFSKDLQIKLFKKPNNFITLLICIGVQFAYFHEFFNLKIFVLTFCGLILGSLILNLSKALKKIIHREKWLGYLFKMMSIFLIINAFGASFNMRSNSSPIQSLDFGSALIFFMSCLILFVYHYQQKRNRSILLVLPKSKTLTAGIFLIFLIMFGDFL